MMKLDGVVVALWKKQNQKTKKKIWTGFGIDVDNDDDGCGRFDPHRCSKSSSSKRPDPKLFLSHDDDDSPLRVLQTMSTTEST